MKTGIELPQIEIDSSSIEWTGPTWNPWQGCIKVSDGCKFCYMYADKKRYGKDPRIVHRSADATFNKPLKWQKEVERGVRNGQDKLAFTCSWSDWFIKEADEWRMDAWNIIRLCPDITFQILTKRIERAAENLPPFWDEIRDHVWLGTSVENQKAANERIPHLLRCPASVRFLSCEPLLEGVGLVGAHETIPYEFDATGLAWSGSNVQYERLKPAGIHWVIVGGESGAGARVCDVEWIERIVADCRVAGIPCFVKQLGAQPHGYLLGAWGESKKSRLNIRDRKGGDPAEWPEALRVREFPQIRVSGGAS